MLTNPILENAPLPLFKSIQYEHMLEAIQTLITDNLAAVDKITSAATEASWDDVQRLEVLDNKLSKAWSSISHLNNVCDSKELRKIYDECLALVSDYSTKMNQNEALYQRYKALDEKAGQALSTHQNKVVKNALRDFELSGVALDAKDKVKYAELDQKLSQLSSKFGQNVLDATMAWSKFFSSEADLPGLPESALKAAAEMAKHKNQEGYLITLEFPSYIAVMTYCDDRALRKEVYTAYSTRASELEPDGGTYDNSAIMHQIVMLRQERAQLLGFDHYVDYSLATKMAASSEEVMMFLELLAKKSKAQAEQEMEALRHFALQECQLDTLEAWDIAYCSEKLRTQRYAISQEELRVYFPENKVIEGMFMITEKLFNVKFRQEENDNLWHEDVTFYQVFDSTDRLLGSFYMDLYARPGKRGGAWMADYQGRFRESKEQLQLPVAFLNCNFSRPLGDKPALFTHEEVTTLFHEFGHGLHHLLTQVDHLSVSGINGVPWDAVELPSQFMENFCWHEASLKLIAGHVEDNSPLPQEKLEKLLAAKNFQSAMQMVRQLEFALFDIKIHLEPEGKVDIQSVLNQVRQEVAVVLPPEFNRFQNSFSHIFAGGYAAGYYSYKWAEVLSADAFSLFEERSIMDSETGLSFKKHILEAGGSNEPALLFKAFRGRHPSVEALLRHSGIGV